MKHTEDEKAVNKIIRKSKHVAKDAVTQLKTEINVEEKLNLIPISRGQIHFFNKNMNKETKPLRVKKRNQKLV